MREARELRAADDRWRPLAQRLAARFAAAGASDEGMIQAAVSALAEVEKCESDSSGPAVSRTVRALRQHRREQERKRPAPVLPAAIAAAGSELFALRRRSPTVAEVAVHLNVDEEQVIDGLVAG
jgi:RNA polymerase sigma-B factor